jgi:hypothetical protein
MGEAGNDRKYFQGSLGRLVLVKSEEPCFCLFRDEGARLFLVLRERDK